MHAQARGERRTLLRDVRGSRSRSRTFILAAISVLAASAAVVGMGAPATATTDYPNKQITIVVPYPPGGILDVVGRIVADGLSSKFNQPVIVVNRVGGGGSVGIGEVVRAPPDGYTLLVANDGSHAILPFVDPNFKFDPLRDFVPIAMPVEYAHALLISARLPPNSVPEFIAYAKARPDALAFGTPGYGSLAQVAMELFMQQTGIKMLHVPYKGSAQALSDLMVGVIAANLQSITGVIPQIGNPSIKILAVTSRERVPALPDIPTITESGLPQFVVTSWLGIMGPAGLPAAVRDKLSEAIVEITKAPGPQARLRALGVNPVALDASAFAAFYVADVARWKQVVISRDVRIPQ